MSKENIKKLLIPEFIINKYQENSLTGLFNAFVMIVDISGFTKMTEKLMEYGTSGAEAIADILKSLFNESVGIIYENNGFIVNFAGDAFTSIFIDINGVKKSNNVISCIKNIQNVFKRQRFYKWKNLRLEFNTKISVSFGQVNWEIFGKDKQSLYCFSGEAVREAIQSEKYANKSEIWINNKAFLILRNKIIKYIKYNNNYKILLFSDLLRIRKRKFLIKKEFKKIQQFFSGIKEFNFPKIGEFRDVIVIFISIKNKEILKIALSDFYKIDNIFEGSHLKLDYGDKGINFLKFFGAPKSYENNDERALRYVLNLSKLDYFKDNICIGMTKGRVYCGFNGAEFRKEFACIGYTTNLAARFMSYAKWGDILVDKNIEQNKKYLFKYIENIEYKGFKSKIPTYKLIDRRGIKDISYLSGFIGRKYELDILKKYLNGINNKIIYIDGETGIGKTRFAKHFFEKYLKNKNVLWLRFPNDNIFQEDLFPIKFFLNTFFNQNVDYTYLKNRVEFSKKYNKLLKNIKNKETVEKLKKCKFFIGSIIDLYWKNSIYQQLEPECRYNNVLNSLKELIIALSLIKPVILEFDDAHNLDNESKKFLKILHKNIGKNQISTIFISRFLKSRKKFNLNESLINEKRIELKSFNKNEIKLFTEAIIKNNSLNNIKISENLIELISNNSDGNPLYIEQVLLYLSKNRLENNFEIQKIKIPSNINSIIISRIDDLSESLKKTIKIASVIGRDFSSKILKEVIKEENVEEILNEGEQNYIWHRTKEDNYIFNSILLRDVIYNMQLIKQLKMIHNIIALAIEKLYKNNLDSFYFKLGFHYKIAGNNSKSIFFFNKAIKIAEENFQNNQVINIYDNLLDLTKNKIDIIRFEQKKIEKLIFIGSIKEALIIAENILKKSIKLKNICLISENYILLSEVFRHLDDFKTSIKYCIKAIKGFKKKNNKKEIIKAYMLIADSLTYIGKIDKAINLLKVCEKKIDFKRTNNEKIKFLILFGSIYSEIGNLDKALKYLNLALKYCKDNIIQKAHILGNIGIVYYRKNKLKKAESYYLKVFKLSKKAGDLYSIANVYSNLGAIKESSGKNKEAFKYFNKFLNISIETGYLNNQAIAYCNIGNCKINLGQYIDSEILLIKGLEITKKLSYKQLESFIYALLSKIELEKNNKRKSIIYIDKAIKIAKEVNIPYYLCEYYLHKAIIKLKEKKNKESLHLLKKANEISIQINRKTIIFEAKILYYKIISMDNKRKAINKLIELIKKSKTSYEKAEINFLLWDIDRALKYKQTAIKIYKKIVKKSDNYEILKKLNLLLSS